MMRLMGTFMLIFSVMMMSWMITPSRTKGNQETTQQETKVSSSANKNGDGTYYVSSSPGFEKIDDIAESIPYLDFKEYLNESKVNTIYANFGTEKNSDTMYFTLKNDDTIYITLNPNADDSKEQFLEAGAEVLMRTRVFETTQGEEIVAETEQQTKETQKVNLSAFIASAAIVCGAIIFVVMRKKKRAEVNPVVQDANSKKGQPATAVTFKKTFEDVGGLTQLKQDLKAVVDFLKFPDSYKEAGANLPKGILLVGPPGTGKTLLAQVMASEAGVNFVYANASDFVEMYVGVGASRVRELFKKARAKEPCIVFIDEIDTIAGKRDGNMHSEDRKALTALLTEMDGFKQDSGILVIGATNRVEDMDSAAIRSGRFTDIFTVPVPETVEERLEIIDIYMKDKKFAEDFDKQSFAEEMIGHSPADIEEIFNEAAIISVRKRLPAINRECIDEAVYKKLMHGHQKDNKETDRRDLKLIAYHEGAHTLVAKLGGNHVTKVTIMPSTSGAGGVTFIQPYDRKLYTKEMMEQKIMELYAGRVGEYLVSGRDWNKTTQGCSNDIEQATKLLKQMVDAYGMGDNGMVNMGILSRETNAQSIEYIKKLAEELKDKTVKLIEENFEKLEAIAEALLKKDTLYEVEIDEILGIPHKIQLETVKADN